MGIITSVVYFSLYVRIDNLFLVVVEPKNNNFHHRDSSFHYVLRGFCFLRRRHFSAPSAPPPSLPRRRRSSFIEALLFSFPKSLSFLSVSLSLPLTSPTNSDRMREREQRDFPPLSSSSSLFVPPPADPKREAVRTKRPFFSSRAPHSPGGHLRERKASTEKDKVGKRPRGWSLPRGAQHRTISPTKLAPLKKEVVWDTSLHYL